MFVAPFRSWRVLLVSLPILCWIGCSRSPCREELTKHGNGRLKRAGKVCNGLKQGRWIEDYADGAVRWEGDYLNDTLVVHPPADSSIILVNFPGGTPRVGQEAALRIRVGDIHPSLLRVTVSNGTIGPAGDPDMYDHAVRPSVAGLLQIRVGWTDPRTGQEHDLGQRSVLVNE
ncbi:MAG TPA: hypothetical protein VHL57_11760 [Flavobacteriales bacterium]|jgi:hypothetical protein|nr:hypothetical protein [Flavobacteriales bacterium]